MEKKKVMTVSEFPLCPNKRKFLLYYTVRSTRVTVFCCGMRHILLYSDEKRIKTFHLPEEVICATIINTPLTRQDKKGNTQFLVCGTSQGSSFALPLPSSKDDLKKRSSGQGVESDFKKEFVLVYKYAGLEIFSILCIDGHLVLFGNDGTGQKLLLFQPSVLHNALEQFDCQKTTGKLPRSAHTTCESVSITPPSVASSIGTGNPNVVLFHSSESHSSPFYISLDKVQNIDKELYLTLFGAETTSTVAPVVCLLYPSGEIWYRSLGYEGGLVKRQLNRLCCLQETCAAVVAVLLGPEFVKSQFGAENDATSSIMGLMLFGKDKGASILYKNENTKNDDPKFETLCIPYTSEVKSFVCKWNNMVSCHEIFLSNISALASGVNVTSLSTNFISEQQVGMKSNRVWTWTDYGEHMSLLSISLSDLWAEHSFSHRPPNDGIQNLLTELEGLNLQIKGVKTESDEMTGVLKALSALTMHAVEKNFEFLQLELSHCMVKFSDSQRLCINLTVSNKDVDSILEPFLYNLHVSVKSEHTPVSHTYAFDLKNFSLGRKEKLCILVENEEIDCGKIVKINGFLNVSGMKNSKSLVEDVSQIVNSGFPCIIPVFSECFNTPAK